MPDIINNDLASAALTDDELDMASGGFADAASVTYVYHVGETLYGKVGPDKMHKVTIHELTTVEENGQFYPAYKAAINAFGHERVFRESALTRISENENGGYTVFGSF